MGTADLGSQLAAASSSQPVPWGRLVALSPGAATTELVGERYTFGRLPVCDVSFSDLRVR